MITNMIGFSKNQDNKSILKIMLTPNQPSQLFKAKWMRNLKQMETKINSQKKGRKIELCWVNK